MSFATELILLYFKVQQNFRRFVMSFAKKQSHLGSMLCVPAKLRCAEKTVAVQETFRFLWTCFGLGKNVPITLYCTRKIFNRKFDSGLKYIVLGYCQWVSQRSRLHVPYLFVIPTKLRMTETVAARTYGFFSEQKKRKLVKSRHI